MEKKKSLKKEKKYTNAHSDQNKTMYTSGNYDTSSIITSSIITNEPSWPSANYSVILRDSGGIDYLLHAVQPAEAAERYELEDDDLLDDPEDGKPQGWLAEIAAGGIDFSQDYAVEESEEVENKEYADPKLLLPDLYSASLFAEEEEISYFPPAILYQAHQSEYEVDYFALLEKGNEPELPEVGELPTELSTEVVPLAAKKEELDLEERLAA